VIGVGRRLWTALAISYLALGLLIGLLYGASVAASAVGVLGAVGMLGLAFAVAWASGELAARRERRRRP
jgi:hypothetical protein